MNIPNEENLALCDMPEDQAVEIFKRWLEDPALLEEVTADGGEWHKHTLGLFRDDVCRLAPLPVTRPWTQKDHGTHFKVGDKVMGNTEIEYMIAATYEDHVDLAGLRLGNKCNHASWGELAKYFTRDGKPCVVEVQP